jgi:IS30 family transposase
MPKTPPLTPAQHDAIAELRGDKGWTIKRIAAHLGVTHGAVAYRCLIDGIEKPGPVPAPTEWRGPMVSQRGAYPVRRFTAEEDEWIVEYESRGHSHAEIGRRLGRKPNSIKGRLATLARREERALAQTEQKS